jgi:uncharacterized repeat protein (TIGR03803 family)
MKFHRLLLLFALAASQIGLEAWAVTETTIHTFAGGSYSGNPIAGLVFDSAGNAYGTALSGGEGYGTIFELSPSQSGWTATLLYSFDNIGGASPFAPLVLDSAGNLYGTAIYGGNTTGACQGSGCGTVFELAKVDGGWQFQVLYEFTGGSDSAHPQAGLVFDNAGNLYGTAAGGTPGGMGAVFELSPSNGTWQESTLYTFAGGSDGATPLSGLTADADGAFYGTTVFGGPQNLGTVYKLTREGLKWTETVLYAFIGPDGSEPQAGPLLFRKGILYGTTDFGGEFNQGTVFSLRQSNNTVVENVLYSFATSSGKNPYGGVVSDAAGNLYGTTAFGGSMHEGVAFVLRNVSGSWHEFVLHNFSGATDGSSPTGTPAINQGALFGITNGGGEWGAGVAWEIAPI